MSRRKKGKTRQPEPKREPVRTLPELDPPRPSFPLLVFSAALTVLWIGALVILALAT